MAATVSIVIPTFDRPEMLQRALRSALTQTSAAYEIIVVDNGRNPQTQPCIQSVEAESGGNAPIRYLPSKLFDVRHALATGIEASRGDWVILLDDDDFLVPDRLKHDQQVIAHVDAETVVLVQDFLRVDYERELVWEHRMAHKTLGLHQALVLDSFPPPPAGTWKGDTLKAHHSFHQPEGWMTDFDLYASLLPHGGLTKTNRTGYVMDDTPVPGRLTSNIDKAIHMIELHRERFRENRKYTEATDREIDDRLDSQIAFFAGKALRLRALGGITAPYSRKHIKETLKGCIAPLRAKASRHFADQMPEMRGSKTYTLERFSKDHPSLSTLIKRERLTPR